jgi:hypothetical protein
VDGFGPVQLHTSRCADVATVSVTVTLSGDVGPLRSCVYGVVDFLHIYSLAHLAMIYRGRQDARLEPKYLQMSADARPEPTYRQRHSRNQSR